MDERENSERLHRQTEALRIQLIDGDIDLALTFLSVAKTGLILEQRTHIDVDRLVERAERAYDQTSDLIWKVSDEQEQKRLTEKHRGLGAAIREMRMRLQ